MNHLTKTQEMCLTQFTKTGELNMKNRKPYRTKEQKKLARKFAVVEDGRYVSDVPVSYHR